MISMNRYLRHQLVRPAAVLVALGLVMGLARLTLPVNAEAETAAQPGRAPIGRVTVVCPEPSLSRVAVATAPGGDGTGSADVRLLGAKGKDGDGQLKSVQRRGVVWTEEFGENASATVVHARQSMAASLEAEQVSNTERGLSGTRCTRPATNFWFVGDGVELGRTTKLYLVNVDNVPVTLTVDVYGPKGPVATLAGSSITVEPDSRRAIKLGALAPKAPIVALHIETNTGRIAAALHTSVNQGERSGIDWVPATSAPRKKLVVPGLPGGEGPRRLLLAVPGDRPARVQMQVVTTEGTYAVQKKKAVRVPPGSVKSIGLAQALSERAGAVRITSNVPVTAAAGVSAGEDVTYVSAVSSIGEGGAVVSANGPGSDVTSTLLLTAPTKPAAVRVRTFGHEGPVGQTDVVKIPTGRTVSVEVPAPSAVEGNFALVVTPVPGSGPIYGARLLRGSGADMSSMTLLPLETSRGWVRMPNAEEGLGSIIER